LHRRYENGVVDAHIDRYGAAVLGELPTAKILRDPRDLVFEQMFRTYEVVQVIVDADRSAARHVRRGSKDYYTLLDEDLRSVTVRQLSSATSMIGSLWLTAWQEGQGSSGKESQRR
jgi:hypothetical protein